MAVRLACTRQDRLRGLVLPGALLPREAAPLSQQDQSGHLGRLITLSQGYARGITGWELSTRWRMG
jgi:hypothetical protein